MSKSSGDNAITLNKRPGQTGTLVGTRFQPTALDRVDAWRKAQVDLPTRPEAIRRLVDRGLENRSKG